MRQKEFATGDMYFFYNSKIYCGVPKGLDWIGTKKKPPITPPPLPLPSYILKQTWCLFVCVFVTDIRGLRPGQLLRGAGRGAMAFYTSSVDA
jgi:hypothetical protein